MIIVLTVVYNNTNNDTLLRSGWREHRRGSGPALGQGQKLLHPVSVRRFPSFLTQPMESLSHYLGKKRFLSNPAPGENLLSGNLVMETGCTIIISTTI